MGAYRIPGDIPFRDCKRVARVGEMIFRTGAGSGTSCRRIYPISSGNGHHNHHSGDGARSLSLVKRKYTSSRRPTPIMQCSHSAFIVPPAWKTAYAKISDK